MTKRFMIIDGNSLGHAANASSVLTIGETQVQAVFGFMRTLRSLLKLHSNITPVVLWDGASWRKMILNSYKEIRERDGTAAERKIQDNKNTFKSQAGAIRKGLELLGVTQVHALNMEADDLAAILVDKFEARGDKILLMTGDKDWIQLISPNVVWHNPINNKGIDKVRLVDLKEKLGVDTIKQFVEMKALMGDAGDSVPGVGGIGQKGALEFLATYGSHADFCNQVLLEKTIDPKTLPKKYRDLVQDETKLAAFTRNLQLVDLRTTARPAPINLTINKGTPDLERFRVYCEKLMFRSMLADLGLWTSVFPAFQPLEMAA